MTADEKEFVITHVFKNISSMKDDEKHFSPLEKHFGVPWKIKSQRNKDHLGLYFHCEKEKNDKEWSIECSRTFSITSADGSIFSKTGERMFKSTDKSKGWGWNDFIEWEDMIKNYVIDDTLTVEVHVTIEKMTGISKNLMSFDESTKEFSDVVLVVEDQKFYVSKLFLACNSPYFNALLSGNFEESGKPEITLQDVNAAEFQNFLELLYGAYPVKESTIEGIIDLSDMYNAELAIQKCEQFLIENSNKSLKEKLQLAYRYNLQNLKDSCLSKITTSEDIRSVLTDDFSEMDPSVVEALKLKSLALNEI